MIAGAAIGGFLLILAFIVWITRDPALEVPATAATLPVMKTTPQQPAAAVPPPPAAPEPPMPVVSPPSASAAAGAALAPERTVQRPVPANNIARNRVMIRPTRVAPRELPAREPPPQPKAAPTPQPVAAPAAPDCNPPYYFDGAKKVFKPACL
jgi:hypothetical protein